MQAEIPAFNESPRIAIWEMTRSCGLKCVHCRAEAIDRRDPRELSTAEAFKLLDDLGDLGAPLVVLTGGDPLRRPDVFEIVRYGTQIGLRMAATPSATAEMTAEKVARLKDAGLARLAVSLDAPDAACHDAFRQVQGSFGWTMDILRWAREANLETQINTTVTRHNLDRFDEMAALMETLGIALWSVFFLVPTGRGRSEEMVRGREMERVLERMAELSGSSPFDIKSTEAPHYRRVLIQKRKAIIRSEKPGGGVIGRTKGVNDGKGFVFVSHTGDIYPSGFLPLVAGNVRTDSLADVYRRSPLFTQLRDSSQLKGKCGACEFKNVCGGSRARAFGVWGDPLECDPFCVHVPAGYEPTEAEKSFW